MWGIFAHVNLSRVLGQKGQLWPGSLTSSLIQNNFIIFFPQSPLSFPFKKNEWPTFHTGYWWLWHTSAQSCASREGWSRCSNTLPINLIWHPAQRMLGKTIEPSPHTLKLQLQKITAERGGSFLATKMHPSLSWSVWVAQHLVGAQAGFWGRGGGLKLWICHFFLNWLLVLILSEKKGVLVW